MYEGHSKSFKPLQEGVTQSRNLLAIFNKVPLLKDQYTSSSDVRELHSPHGRGLHPGFPITPLQYGLFPNWRPGRCDFKFWNKQKSDGAESGESGVCRRFFGCHVFLLRKFTIARTFVLYIFRMHTSLTARLGLACSEKREKKSI